MAAAVQRVKTLSLPTTGTVGANKIRKINATWTNASGSAGSKGYITTIGQLLEGHYEAQKLTGRAVYPRPDTETSAYAYHRIGFYNGGTNQLQQRFPVVVYGMAAPLRYRLLTGPSGMAIGENYGDSNYGYITWTPSGYIRNDASVNCAVLVIGQDGETLVVTWSVRTSDDNATQISTAASQWQGHFCVFDSSTGSDAAAGTFAAPYQTLSLFFTAAAARNNRTAVFRAGSYSVPSGSPQFTASNKPRSIVSFNSELVEFDFSATTQVNTGGASDSIVARITFKNFGSSTNTRLWVRHTACDRQTICEITVKDVTGFGSVGTSNATCFYFQQAWVSNDPALGGSYYSVLKDCVFDNVVIPCWDYYAQKYFVVEGNTWQNSTIDNTTPGYVNGTCFGKNKGNWTHCSFRYNQMKPSVTITGTAYNEGLETLISATEYGWVGADGMDYSEWCFNTLVAGDRSRLWDYRGDGDSSHNCGPHMYAYRNTTVGGDYDLEFETMPQNGNTLKWDKNVVVNTAGPSTSLTLPTYTMTNTECHGTTAAGIVDANGLLTGTYRTNYLGIRGAEIA